MTAGNVATYSVPNCPWCGMLSRSKPEHHREWETVCMECGSEIYPPRATSPSVQSKACKEIAALRRQVEELGDVVPPPGFEASEYAAINHIGMPLEFPKICKRGPGAWAAFVDDCTCIGKDAELHYELRPSNRTPEFIALTRFATPHAAARALRSGGAVATPQEGKR